MATPGAWTLSAAAGRCLASLSPGEAFLSQWRRFWVSGGGEGEGQAPDRQAAEVGRDAEGKTEPGRRTLAGAGAGAGGSRKPPREDRRGRGQRPWPGRCGCPGEQWRKGRPRASTGQSVRGRWRLRPRHGRKVTAGQAGVETDTHPRTHACPRTHVHVLTDMQEGEAVDGRGHTHTFTSQHACVHRHTCTHTCTRSQRRSRHEGRAAPLPSSSLGCQHPCRGQRPGPSRLRGWGLRQAVLGHGCGRLWLLWTRDLQQTDSRPCAGLVSRRLPGRVHAPGPRCPGSWPVGLSMRRAGGSLVWTVAKSRRLQDFLLGAV